DAHHLIGSTRAETWLRTLVTLLPSTCHLILISRVLPKLPLTEMVERQEVLALSQEELRFTLAETRELARRSDTDISDLTLEKVAARLNGWPAGIILSLRPLPSDLVRLLFGGSTWPEALFGTLADH